MTQCSILSGVTQIRLYGNENYQDRMPAVAHLRELENKHANLDRLIKSEMKSPHPDTLRITNLKKQKLHLKDRITANQID